MNVMNAQVNILLVLGCSGKRWRRLLVVPWLLCYGAGVVICIWTHLYYTSLCWREEKVSQNIMNYFCCTRHVELIVDDIQDPVLTAIAKELCWAETETILLATIFMVLFYQFFTQIFLCKEK